MRRAVPLLPLQAFMASTVGTLFLLVLLFNALYFCNEHVIILLFVTLFTIITFPFILLT